MAVDDDAAAGHLWRQPRRGVAREHFTQHDGLFAEPDCALIFGEEVDEFVTEDAGAAWFEHDDGNAGCDLRLKLVEDAEQVATRFIEESEVVERAAAADVSLGNLTRSEETRV